MNKIILLFLALLTINNCGYNPILANKTYDFNLENINADKESKINSILKNYMRKMKLTLI